MLTEGCKTKRTRTFCEWRGVAQTEEPARWRSLAVSVATAAVAVALAAATLAATAIAPEKWYLRLL